MRGSRDICAELVLHPDCRTEAVSRVEAELRALRGGLWSVTYLVSGSPGELRIPPPAPPRRTHGLWRTTCFELFVGGGGESGYAELNFSPSGEWAAYNFAGYRTGMAEADLPPPRIASAATADLLELRAEFALPTGRGGRVALAAIIEETGGAKSYWALAHPPGPPDFHHPDCFALELPPLG